jgi:hypothetical protein
MASIDNMRRIVCLANSRKSSGRCVATLEREQKIDM